MYHLVGEHEDGLEGELGVAGLEELLEVGPQQVHHQGAVVALDAEPPDIWNPGCECTSKKRIILMLAIFMQTKLSREINKKTQLHHG